jgi:glycosidase
MMLADGRANIRIWDEERLTTWFDDFLPTLDLSKPEVAQIQSDSALFWIKKYNLDGFRHDATKHVPIEFWRTLTHKMKTEVIQKDKRPVYQIGETFGNNELISSYLGSGLLDAQFNFNLYFDMRDQFSVDNGDLSIIGNSLRQSCNYFGFNNTMGVITGNHDLTRFMGLASKAVKPNEDPKEAGYAREIKIIDRNGYKKLQMLLGFIMTVPGIPIVYYGDEIGMVGAGDPDNRRPMRFDGLNADEILNKKKCAELAKIRINNMALLYGNLEIISSEKDLLVYERSYLNNKVWVCFNSSKSPKKVNIDLSATEPLKLKSFSGKSVTSSKNKLTIDIPAQNFEIIYTKK